MISVLVLVLVFYCCTCQTFQSSATISSSACSIWNVLVVLRLWSPHELPTAGVLSFDPWPNQCASSSSSTRTFYYYLLVEKSAAAAAVVDDDERIIIIRRRMIMMTRKPYHHCYYCCCWILMLKYCPHHQTERFLSRLRRPCDHHHLCCEWKHPSPDLFSQHQELSSSSS